MCGYDLPCDEVESPEQSRWGEVAAVAAAAAAVPSGAVSGVTVLAATKASAKDSMTELMSITCE